MYRSLYCCIFVLGPVDSLCSRTWFRHFQLSVGYVHTITAVVFLAAVQQFHIVDLEGHQVAVAE